MKLVVQRVKSARVKLADTSKVVGEIKKGLFILVGIGKEDYLGKSLSLAEKISRFRIISDEKGKMNLSVKETDSEILVVSQFTLYADTSGGNRPSFIDAAPPDVAENIFNEFVEDLRNLGLKVQTGKFGEYMEIETELDGPVTILFKIMSIFKKSLVWEKIVRVFLTSLTAILFFVVFTGVYYLGFLNGYNFGISEIKELFPFDREKEEVEVSVLTPVPTKKPIVKTVVPKISWGGPELWEEVNKKRVENGVSQLAQRDELCTIASIRLNELLNLDNLDGHEGFGTMREDRPDLVWIFDKYAVVAEFLAMGGETPQETVSLWENTLGHRKLLDGGEYVWGCIYAQNSFAVAITAY